MRRFPKEESFCAEGFCQESPCATTSVCSDAAGFFLPVQKEFVCFGVLCWSAAGFRTNVDPGCRCDVRPCFLHQLR